MNLLLETNRDGNLVLRREGLNLSRYLIGVPMLLFGMVLLYGAISAPFITLREQGSSGLANALMGSFVMLLFAALTLPLGWWMVFSRFWIVFDTHVDEVVVVSDWRLGRKEKRTPLDRFRSIRLAVEHLSGDPHRSNRRGSTHIQMIRLLAKDPVEQPSIELGWLLQASRARAEEVAAEISRHIKLPLEVIEGSEPVLTPVEQLMMDEEESDHRDESTR